MNDYDAPGTTQASYQAQAPAPESVLKKIQALLNLSNKNDNSNEAASAAAKAQELLEEWNLDVAALENAASFDGKREDEKVKGGFYRWQRDLWKSVAELHFCIYFVTEVWDKNQHTHKHDWNGKMIRGAYVKRHRVVGRRVNVQTTIHLARYLEDAIEIQVKERTQGLRSQAFSNWAISFRVGAASNLISRLEERRLQRVKDAVAKARDTSGFSTSTALTIKDIEDRELEANQDFLYGEGWTAKRAAERARYAEENRLKREAYTKWAAENPEEAAAKAAEQREADEKWYRKHRSRGGAGPRDNTDYSAYRSGHAAAAANISLDQQVHKTNVAGMIAR